MHAAKLFNAYCSLHASSLFLLFCHHTSYHDYEVAAHTYAVCVPDYHLLHTYILGKFPPSSSFFLSFLLTYIAFSVFDFSSSLSRLFSGVPFIPFFFFFIKFSPHSSLTFPFYPPFTALHILPSLLGTPVTSHNQRLPSPSPHTCPDATLNSEHHLQIYS